MRRMTNLIAAAALALAIPAAMPAAAQQLIGAYTAFIGTDDLYNSSGARLTQPWQVLRQDRANYHRFGIRHAGDEWDPFFGSIENRAAMERMIMNCSMDPIARQNLLQGGATVFVRIYGAGGVGRYVDVTVAR